MCVNANAVLRSWTLLAAFGGSYAPDNIDVYYEGYTYMYVLLNMSFYGVYFLYLYIQAIKNRASLRVWILFILIVLSFALLFLDWYS